MADRAKSAVVTGGSSGIGRAIAACLLDDGWQVLGSARNEQDAAAAKEALGAAFTPLVFDVARTLAGLLAPGESRPADGGRLGPLHIGADGDWFSLPAGSARVEVGRRP